MSILETPPTEIGDSEIRVADLGKLKPGDCVLHLRNMSRRLAAESTSDASIHLQVQIREVFSQLIHQVLAGGAKSDLASLYDGLCAIYPIATCDRTRLGVLFDLYQMAQVAAAKLPNGEMRLLQSFVWHTAPRLRPLFPSDEKQWADTSWREHVAELILRYELAEGNEHIDDELMLWAVLRLYSVVFGGCDTEAAAAMSKNLRDEVGFYIEAAQCASNDILRTQAPPKAGSDQAGRVAKLLCALYSTYYSPREGLYACGLNDLVLRLTSEESEQRNIKRAVKYWGAFRKDRNVLHAFLSNKANYEYRTATPVNMSPPPMSKGCDNWILVMGKKNVGKTSFLFASERHLGGKLKVLHRHATEGFVADASTVKERRDKWLSGAWSTTEDQNLAGETPVSDFSRFRFFDIGGESLSKDQQHEAQHLSLLDILKFLRPNAYVLMLDPQHTEKETREFSQILDWISDDARNNTAHVPVYLMVNKSDELIPSNDGVHSKELQSYFNGNVALVDDGESPFFSSREYGCRLDASDLLDCAQNSRGICKSPSFTKRLLTDISRCKSLIDALRRKQFAEITFVYTICSPKDTDVSSQSIRRFWAALGERFRAGAENRKEFLRKTFIEQTKRSAQNVARFQNGVTLNTNSLADSWPERGKVDFDAVVKNSASKNEELLSAAGVSCIEDKLSKIITRVEQLETHVADALPSLLTELGVPPRKAPNDLCSFARIPSGYREHLAELAKKKECASRLSEDGPPLPSAETLTAYFANELHFPNSLVDSIVKAIQSMVATPSTEGFGGAISHFHYIWGSTAEMCTLRDRPLTSTEEEILDVNSGENLLELVSSSFDQPDSVNVLLRILANYYPVYPLLTFDTVDQCRLWDNDHYRHEMFRSISELLSEQQTRLVNLIVDLLAIQASMVGLKRTFEQWNIWNRYETAKELLASSPWKDDVDVSVVQGIRKACERWFKFGSANEMKELLAERADSLGCYNSWLRDSDGWKTIGASADILDELIQFATSEPTERPKEFESAKDDINEALLLLKERLKELVILCNRFNEDLESYASQQKSLLLNGYLEYLKASGWIPYNRLEDLSSYNPRGQIDANNARVDRNDVERKLRRMTERIAEIIDSA